MLPETENIVRVCSFVQLFKRATQRKSVALKHPVHGQIFGWFEHVTKKKFIYLSNVWFSIPIQFGKVNTIVPYKPFVRYSNTDAGLDAGSNTW